MRLLLLTYHFPPEPCVGGDRPFSLFGRAEAHGIRMRIATANGFGSLPQEDKVHRFDTAADWKSPSTWPAKPLSKLKTKVLEPFSLNQDFTWKKNLHRFFDAASLRRNFDALYAIYPTNTALCAALEMSRKSGLPFIVDFTDSLCFEPLEALNPCQRRYREGLEGKAVGHAALILSVAESLTTYLRSHYPRGKVETVYNGFDREDFAGIPGLQDRRPDGKIRIVHFGSINRSRARDVTPLFEAVLRLKERFPKGEAKFEFVFLGHITEGERRAAEERGLGDVVRFPGYVEKRQGFRFIREYGDYLLLYGVPGDKSTVTSKLLEYLGLGLPILGICRGNEAERIILRAGSGECSGFSASEIEGLFQRALRREIRFAPDAEVVSEFDRETQAGRIFSLLQAAVKV